MGSSFRITRTLFASCTPSKQDLYHGTKILNKKMWEIDTFSNYEDLQNLPIISNIQWEVSKHHQKCLLQFLLDFNRLLKSIKKGHSKRPLPPHIKGILLN